MELVEERTGMRLTVGLKHNVAERVLDSLKLRNSGLGCTVENRVCVVQAGTDQGVCYERSCMCVNGMSEMTKSLYMVETGLGNKVNVLMESEGLVESDTKEFDTLSQWNS